MNKLRFWLFKRRYKRWSTGIKPKRKPFMSSYHSIDREHQQRLMELLQEGLQGQHQQAQRHQMLAGLSGNILGMGAGALFGGRDRN